MEGDAGTSRLNPNEGEESTSETETEQASTVEVGPDEASTEVDTDDITETDAGDPTKSEASLDEAAESPVDGKTPSRVGRGWLIGIAAVLVLLAGGLGAGGYFAWRSDHESQDVARRDAAALQAAKDCVAATQAPDTQAMAAAAQKMIDCGAGAFRSQAILYSGLLVEAYQAANAQVKVSDLRAAVERNNADGSVDVLVPLRVKVTNSAEQNQEVGYRLRVTMVSEDGKYRIGKLDQVAK
jgi:Mce-associated membrane protein